MPRSLAACKFVFLCDDTVKSPLQAPYTSLYQVVSAKEQTMDILIDDCVTTVSLHRIKPAFVELDPPPLSPNEDGPLPPHHPHDSPTHNLGQQSIDTSGASPVRGFNSSHSQSSTFLEPLPTPSSSPSSLSNLNSSGPSGSQHPNLSQHSNQPASATPTLPHTPPVSPEPPPPPS